MDSNINNFYDELANKLKARNELLKKIDKVKEKYNTLILELQNLEKSINLNNGGN